MDNIKKYLLYFFNTPFSFLAFLIILIISPLCKFRLAKIDFGRIGETYPIDWYISEKENNIKTSFDIFFVINSTNNLNKTLYDLFKKKVYLTQSYYFYNIIFNLINLFKLSQLLIPVHGINYSYHEIKNKNFYENSKKIDIRIKSILKNKQSNLFFSKYQINLGNKFIKKINKENLSIICISGRDSGYLNKFIPQRDWSYHDYRNMNFDNYEKTIEYLIQQKFFVIKMGNFVEDNFIFHNKNYFDYSRSNLNSDFLDIFIPSISYLNICADSGISSIPEYFRRPIVYVNKCYVHLIHKWCLNGLFIYKKFYSKKLKRYLRFNEIIKLDFGGNHNVDFFDKNSIILEENTPDEILLSVKEMVMRIERKWVEKDLEIRLKSDFWNSFGYEQLKSKNFNIAADYIFNNRNLI